MSPINTFVDLAQLTLVLAEKCPSCWTQLWTQSRLNVLPLPILSPLSPGLKVGAFLQNAHLQTQKNNKNRPKHLNLPFEQGH
jgi:hypothetical protein